MPPVPNQETVSQSEVEQLLAQIGGGDSTPVENAAPAAKSLAGELIQRHEFPQLSLFSPGELRKLRVRHEEFIVSLAARLSIHLGLEVGLQMAKLETASFKDFAEGLGNPTHLTVFKLEPLAGHCLLDIPLRLGLCLVDRELGGPGVWKDEPRELTKMESGLLARLVDSVLSEWCSVWKDLLDLRPVLGGVENNSRFLQTCPPDATMLVLGLEARLGAVFETMQLALPYTTLEPLVVKLNASEAQNQKPAAARATTPPKWKTSYEDMTMRVSAEFPCVTISAGQMANLKPGDLIPLPLELAGQVRVFLEEMPKFTGTLGRQNNEWAVKVSHVLKSS